MKGKRCSGRNWGRRGRSKLYRGRGLRCTMCRTRRAERRGRNRLGRVGRALRSALAGRTRCLGSRKQPKESRRAPWKGRVEEQGHENVSVGGKEGGVGGGWFGQDAGNREQVC